MLALNFSLQTHWKAACSRQFCGFDDLQGLSTLLPSFPMCWAYVESSIGAAFLSCPLAGFQHGVLLPAGPALHERPWPLREVGVASRVAQAWVCTQNNCVGGAAGLRELLPWAACLAPSVRLPPDRLHRGSLLYPSVLLGFSLALRTWAQHPSYRVTKGQPHVPLP